MIYLAISAITWALLVWRFDDGDLPFLQSAVIGVMLNLATLSLASMVPSFYLQFRDPILLVYKLRTAFLASAFVTAPTYKCASVLP